MPKNTVVGFRNLTQEQIDDLVVRIKKQTVGVEALGVSEEVVEVFVDNGGYVQKTGERGGYIRVEELFIKGDRDAETRHTLGKMLYEAIVGFATANDLEVPKGFACFINECDLDRGNYYTPSLNLHER